MDPSFKASESALSHLQRALGKVSNPEAMAIRIGVKKAGCSGYEYVLQMAKRDSQTPLDMHWNFSGVNILIDKEIYAKFFKGGTTLIYKKEGVNEGLSFDNPNVADQCGCGESFTLKAEES